MMGPRKVIGMIAVLTTGATPAAAQDFFMGGTSPMDYGGATRAITNGAINKATTRSIIRRNARSGNTAIPAATATSGLISRSIAVPASAAKSVAFPYRSTTASQTEAKAALMQRLTASNPTAAAAMREQLAKHDFFQIYKNVAADSGLSPNDAGDVMTTYLVLGWMIINRQDPTPSAVRAARRQIGTLLAQGGQIADPATRTKVAEEVKLLFVTLHGGWQAAQREGSNAAYAAGTAKLFRSATGDDLARVTLTDAGFRRKG